MQPPNEPLFVRVTEEIHGSIIETPNRFFLCSVFHEPSKRSLYGVESTLDHAYGWLDGSRLVFTDAGGSA